GGILTMFTSSTANQSADSTKDSVISNSKRTKADKTTSHAGGGALSYGPGSILLTSADMTLHEVQCHLDREGASNLVVELIMANPSHLIFVESVELGIALLEGGNSVIQRSIYQKLTQGNNSEKFFKV